LQLHPECPPANAPTLDCRSRKTPTGWQPQSGNLRNEGVGKLYRARDQPGTQEQLDAVRRLTPLSIDFLDRLRSGNAVRKRQCLTVKHLPPDCQGANYAGETDHKDPENEPGVAQALPGNQG